MAYRVKAGTEPALHTLDYSFASGMGPWTSWMSPSLIRDDPGIYSSYMRLQAAGQVDPNHQDGIGSLWLVGHLSIGSVGSPGVLDLRNAQIDLTIKGNNFDANGAKLCFWICSYLPDGSQVYLPTGLVVTNWANTANDLAGRITDDWQTLKVTLSENEADWTYAGTNISSQGDWGRRYAPMDLVQALGAVDATLHLVLIGDDADQPPTGFLDIAALSITMQAPPTPVPQQSMPDMVLDGVEDEAFTGQLIAPDGLGSSLRFELVEGSLRNGAVVIDAETGEFTFAPDADFAGPTAFIGAAEFRYRVTGDLGASEDRRVFLRIAPINDAPTASGAFEGFTISADEPLSHQLFRGDDIDGDTLTFSIAPESVSGGTVELDARTGHYRFTPEAGFIGVAGFSYVVSDGQIESAPKSVTLTIVGAGLAPPLPSLDEVVSTYLIPGDLEGFAKWMIRLANAGDVNAAYHYGTWLVAGRFVTRDAAQGALMLERASDSVPDAKIQLAQLYSSGNGVPRDAATSRALLEELPNDPLAQYRLGLLLDEGLGGDVDKSRAVELFLASAKAGHADAAYTVGRRYLIGSGVAASPEDAYFWIGIGLERGGGPGLAQFNDALRANMAQASGGFSPERRAELDRAIGEWMAGLESPVNDAPTIAPDLQPFVSVAGAVVEGEVLSGFDADGDRLTYHLIEAEGGDVALDPISRRFTFTPLAGYTGSARFTYAAEDGFAESETREVLITVTPPTIATDDSVALDETTEIVADARSGLLSNDTSAAGAISVASIGGLANAVGLPVAGLYGDLTVQADGSYRYLANNAASLLESQVRIDRFAYEIIDEAGTRSSAQLVISVRGIGGTVVQGSGVILGSPFADHLTGSNHRDVLIGLDGADVLAGGTGAADELYGGLGDDSYVVEGEGDTIVELIDQGTDRVLATIDRFRLPANVELLSYTGTGAFVGYGNELANVITGADGDDELAGRAGDDQLNGAGGSDTADYAEASGRIFVNLASGVANQDGEGGVDRLSSIEHVRSSHAGGTIIGDGVANRLTGAVGRDVLVGQDGNDVLIGGPGIANQLQGGRGDDLYEVEASGDTLVEFANEGVDTVITALSVFRLGAHFENLAFHGLGSFTGTGNDLANTITGGFGDDTLNGGGGDDILIGGLGLDSADYSGAPGQVFVNLSIGAASNDGFGGRDRLDGIENVRGNGAGSTLIGDAGGNRLVGGAGPDILAGLGGDDVLVGGAGAANELQGGTGDDRYIVSASGDSLIEMMAEGRDTVETDLAAFTLGQHFEGLRYIGQGSFVGIGNGLSNDLRGGGGNDTLNGRGGIDTLIGGGGDDRFVFDSIADSSASAPDRIADFAPGDRIVLSALDGDQAKAGRQGLILIGNGAFSGKAGELRFEQRDGLTFVEADTTGSGVADFRIELAGLIQLNADSFLLA